MSLNALFLILNTEMSGHSKWAQIKRQKGVADAKRGAVFTRLGKLITVAAREKGGDPAANFSLRMAVEKAKAANMPKENIERAIKRGTGETGGAAIEELAYEAVGPANTQFVITCLTDNKNRTASEIRHIFSKHGGSFGSVMWNFEKKGVVRIMKQEIENQNIDNSGFELELIEAGADDIQSQEEGLTVFCPVEILQNIKGLLEDKNISAESSEVEYVAKDLIEIADNERERLERLVGELEENEDVNDYYTNISNI